LREDDMAITLTGSATLGGGNDITTLTFSHTHVAGNALIVAYAGEGDDCTPAHTATYGGVDMTDLGGAGTWPRAQLYYLSAALCPAGANNVHVHPTNTSKMVVAAQDVSGILSSRVLVTANGNGTTSTSPAMTTVAGDGCFFVNADRAEATDHTGGGGATEVADFGNAYTYIRCSLYFLLATGVSTAMSCSWAGSEDWRNVAIPFSPRPGGNQVIWI
jgi:hypothetical protein